MLPPRHSFIWDAAKLINFLDNSNSNKIELKLLTCKLAMLLALIAWSRTHESCYLDICYLIWHSSATVSTSPRSQKQQRQGKKDHL